MPGISKLFLIILALAAMPLSAQAGGFSLTSTTLKPGGTLPDANVFKGMGCTGGNLSPELDWSAAPANTKSFALTLYDPDAPTGSGWWHWIVYNLPSTTHHLPANAAAGSGLPDAARQGRNDFGFAGYGGACPPPGPAHRYIFTLYALKVAHLDVPKDASAAMIGFMVHQNMLAKATLRARYGR